MKDLYIVSVCRVRVAVQTVNCAINYILTLSSQVSHFNSRNSRFSSFVAVFPSTSVNRLLYGIVGQNTEDYRNVIFNVQVFNSLSYPFTNKVKMFGFTLNYTPDSNHSIYPLSFNHFFAAIDEFKTPRNIPSDDIFF